MKFSKALVASTFIAVLGIIGVGTVSATATVTQPPASVGVATDTALTENVLNARFVNQYGASESLAALKGKTVMVVPLLTLCGDTCPFTSGNLLQVQSDINAAKESNVQIVAISVDPYRDTLKRIKAYDKLINLKGSNLQIWTEQGSTTKPKAPKTSSAVGTGDINANLTAIEKFFGWTVQVVDQDTPPPHDWMAPYEKLTYDINHSDGFWIINAQQQVRFVSGTQPAFTGTLSKVLATFMGYKSNIYKKPVYAKGWTPGEAVQAINWVIATS